MIDQLYSFWRAEEQFSQFGLKRIDHVDGTFESVTIISHFLERCERTVAIDEDGQRLVCNI